MPGPDPVRKDTISAQLGFAGAATVGRVPRRPRGQGPGYFHVTARQHGDDIFRTTDDRRVFLVLLNRVVRDLE